MSPSATRSANVPVAFAAILAGGLIARTGINGVQAALSGGGGGGGGGAAVAGSGGSGAAPLSEQQAAAKYGIPVGILHGVGGMETDYGKLINTSSAGAKGKYQFIASTAASEGYPYTNSSDPTIIGQQTDVAAKFLAQLFHQTGSWEAALRHYSGGGYGLAEVQGKAEGLPTG